MFEDVSLGFYFVFLFRFLRALLAFFLKGLTLKTSSTDLKLDTFGFLICMQSLLQACSVDAED